MSNYKIVLLDDDRIFNFLHSKLIARINTDYEIICYESPVEALNYLLGITIAELPSIVFLDINMPEINGFEFLDKLKEQNHELYQHLKFVIVTSSLSPLDHEVHKRYNVIKAFCNKPLDVEKFQNILATILGST
jgi:CheY-like chemotaxis protein